MTHRIVVPLEDSAQTTRIVPYVRRLASAGSLVVLLQVISDSDLADHASAMLDRTAETFTADGIAVETRVAIGDAGRLIVDTAAEFGADLVAMATDRWTDVDRWLNGSVADWVLRHTPVPVLLAAPETEAHAWPAEHGPNILVPLDGSPLAEAAVAPACRLAQLMGSELVVMRAVGHDRQAESAEAQSYLGEVVDRLVPASVPTLTRVVVGSAEGAIEEIVLGLGIDLIAMATHGRTGLARLVLGSVATRALQHARVPLLIVRPAPLRAAAAVLPRRRSAASDPPHRR